MDAHHIFEDEDCRALICEEVFFVLLEENTPEDIADYLKVPEQLVYEWKDDLSLPAPRQLSQLIHYSGIDLSYLASISELEERDIRMAISEIATEVMCTNNCPMYPVIHEEVQMGAHSRHERTDPRDVITGEDTMQAIASFFDEPTEAVGDQHLGDVLLRYIPKDMSVKALSCAIQLRKSTLRNWLAGQGLPSEQQFGLLVGFLDIDQAGLVDIVRITKVHLSPSSPTFAEGVLEGSRRKKVFEASLKEAQ